MKKWSIYFRCVPNSEFMYSPKTSFVKNYLFYFFYIYKALHEEITH